MKLSAAPTPNALGPHRPLAAGSVTLRDGLLGERTATNVTISLPHGYAMLAQRGALDQLKPAAGDSSGRWPLPPVRDSHVEKIYDSDMYKWLEAVAWSWPASGVVAAGYDEVVRLLRAAQQPDGYRHSWFQTHDRQANCATGSSAASSTAGVTCSRPPSPPAAAPGGTTCSASLWASPASTGSVGRPGAGRTPIVPTLPGSRPRWWSRTA